MLDLKSHGYTANEAWLRLIRRIAEGGTESAPRGLRIKEILCNTTKVDMRWPIVTIKLRKMGYKFLAAEAWWILTGRNDVASIRPYSPHISSFSNDGVRFDGAYGPRIVDQLRYVVDSLDRDQDSRQAVLEIWRPNPRDSKDIPCTLTVQWLIRGSVLNCIDNMRSSDAWLGWPYDTFNFSMLSAYIILLLKHRNPHKFADLKLGALWLTAGSSHLYVDPTEDGAKNIPYSIKDVQCILQEEDRLQDQFGRGSNHYCLPYSSSNWCDQYTILNVDEFDSPHHLIEHLSLCKDRLGAMNWMREFQA